jgi:hypothetical protein
VGKHLQSGTRDPTLSAWLRTFGDEPCGAWFVPLPRNRIERARKGHALIVSSTSEETIKLSWFVLREPAYGEGGKQTRRKAGTGITERPDVPLPLLPEPWKGLDDRDGRRAAHGVEPILAEAVPESMRGPRPEPTAAGR